jgi:hypothetical protein
MKMITNQQLENLIKQAAKEKGLDVSEKRIHTFLVSNARRIQSRKPSTSSKVPTLPAVKQRVTGLNFPVWTYADSDAQAFIPKLMTYWRNSND